ncbi:MAG: hypothetical protein ACYCS7_05995 [Acidimicrobiales bacterium]
MALTFPLLAATGPSASSSASEGTPSAVADILAVWRSDTGGRITVRRVDALGPPAIIGGAPRAQGGTTGWPA